jgi:hypothetical protein
VSSISFVESTDRLRLLFLRTAGTLGASVRTLRKDDNGGGEMKLAEALIQRADAQKRIEQLKARIIRNARVQEGEEPAENPARLLEELEQLAANLGALIKRINRTNAQTAIAEGKTLSDALAERDILVVRRAAYQDLAQAASVTQDRYLRSELKFKSTVPVAETQARADDLARLHRELDAKIQETNWNTELV